MENLCKLCLEISEELFDILNEDAFGLKMEEIISKYIDYEFMKNDKLKNKICSLCWHKLEDFHKFLLTVKEKQGHIADILQMLDTLKDENDIKILNSECELENVVESISLEEIAIISDFDEIDKIKTEDMKCNENKAKKSSSKYLHKSKHPSKKLEVQLLIEKEEYLIESFFDLTCNLCQKILKNFTNLQIHYSDIHNISGYVICCQKKFTKRSALAEHVLLHTKPEQFKCKHCKDLTLYETKRILDKHILENHTSDNIHKCEICDKICKDLKSFERHKLIHLNLNEKQFICTDCEKPYSTLASLTAHKQAVHYLKYIKVCEICGRKYKSKVFFEKHQLEHKGKPLPRVQCKVCKVWLKNEYSLRHHKKLHTENDIVHKCEFCGKICPSRNAVLKHKRFVHIRKRIHVCTTCNKSFKTKIALTEHISTHTGEVLYTCSFCQKQFRSGANYRAHRKRNHFAEWSKEQEEKLKLDNQ